MDKYEWEDPQIGYVVEIPDNKSIIINVGLEEDLTLGSKIVVYEEGPQVIDSKTKETLGRKDFIKAVLEVTESYDNFSICQNVTKKTLNKISYSMASLLTEKEYIEQEELNVNVNQVKDWKIRNNKIEINDPIKRF